jgi:hypothetical protein
MDLCSCYTVSPVSLQSTVMLTGNGRVGGPETGDDFKGESGS